MNKIFYILFIGIILTNCTSNTILKKPDNLIPKEEMINILTDMLLASGGEHIKNLNSQRNVNYFPLIFEKYHIDSTQFKESNFYYTSRIDDYEDILKQVDVRLKKLQKEIQNERSLKDSINNVKKYDLDNPDM